MDELSEWWAAQPTETTQRLSTDATLDDAFKEADTNGDGAVTLDESGCAYLISEPGG